MFICWLLTCNYYYTKSLEAASVQSLSRDTTREQRHEVTDGGRVIYLAETIMAAVHQLCCYLYGPGDIGGSPMFSLWLWSRILPGEIKLLHRVDSTLLPLLRCFAFFHPLSASGGSKPRPPNYQAELDHSSSLSFLCSHTNAEAQFTTFCGRVGVIL